MASPGNNSSWSNVVSTFTSSLPAHKEQMPNRINEALFLFLIWLLVHKHFVYTHILFKSIQSRWCWQEEDASFTPISATDVHQSSLLYFLLQCNRFILSFLLPMTNIVTASSCSWSGVMAASVHFTNTLRLIDRPKGRATYPYTMSWCPNVNLKYFHADNK